MDVAVLWCVFLLTPAVQCIPVHRRQHRVISRVPCIRTCFPTLHHFSKKQYSSIITSNRIGDIFFCRRKMPQQNDARWIITWDQCFRLVVAVSRDGHLRVCTLLWTMKSFALMRELFSQLSSVIIIYCNIPRISSKIHDFGPWTPRN